MIHKSPIFLIFKAYFITKGVNDGQLFFITHSGSLPSWSFSDDTLIIITIKK